MNGLAAVAAPPNVGGGNVVRNVFEQVDGGALEVRYDLRRMPILGFFPGIGPRHQVRRNDQTQRFRADARAVGNDEIAETEERFVFFPHGDVQKRIGSDHEIDAVAVTVVDVAKVPHRVHGIVELRAAEVLTSFDERWDKVRMLGAGQRDHGKSMREGSEVLLQLVRRTAGGYEMDFVKIKTAVGGAGDGKMAVVDGIERTAEKRDTARMMFSGSAVRLRSGQ